MSVTAWDVMNGQPKQALPRVRRRHWSVDKPRAGWQLDLPPHVPVIRPDSTAATFTRLLAKWREGTVLSSSFTEMILDRSYQEIIGLGMEAVPLLLRELAKGPEHLGWALASITRENPITEDMAGDVTAQSDAWLAWGRRNGYI